jgi:ribulose-5-phosphate 4-epimerase/fuculose-1-phosphate aldolase
MTATPETDAPDADAPDAGLTAALGAAAKSVGPMPAGFVPDLPDAGKPLEQERTLRKQELAAAFRLFARFGFAEGVTGHITARDPEFADRFWVNPFGMSFSQIRARDLILVDHAGNVVEGDRPVNRAAFVIHSQVHQARPDVVAAAHTHSVHGKAFSSLGIALDPITQDACAFFEDHGVYAGYRGVVNEADEGRRIGAALAGCKAVILQNHGLLTVGASVAEAAWYFITMERSCQAQLLAMAAGTPRLIDGEMARVVRDQISGPLPGWFQFRPLWDQITAEEPDLLT